MVCLIVCQSILSPFHGYFVCRLYQKLYEGESISNQPDIFLTDPHSQEFNSVSGHHNQTYVHNLSIIGSLVDSLSRLQAWPVSQINWGTNIVT